MRRIVCFRKSRYWCRFFFFSSRRRHTRFDCDWSSDVCSSDLNTVIVVEHDEDAIRHADWVVDLGPGAGVHGGEVVAEGTLEQVLASTTSLTAAYLNGTRAIEVPHRSEERRVGKEGRARWSP